MSAELKKATSVIRTVCQSARADDANNLGVNNGQDVTIFNGQGPLTIEVVVTERVSTGVLWSPRPLTEKHGVPLNSLASGNPQSLGSGPRLNSIRVRLEASLTK